jgi:ketosteroid isomerase-like protein
MDEDSLEALVRSFNDCIARRDIDGLAKLMTDDHTFIDAAGGTVSGKSRCIEAWAGFFAAFPDYRNHFERVLATGDTAVIVGHSTCYDSRLAGQALWTATIRGGRIAEWRVFDDTDANRAMLGL